MSLVQLIFSFFSCYFPSSSNNLFSSSFYYNQKMSGQVRSWEELRVLEVGVNSLELNREGSNVFARGSFLTFGFSQFTVSLLYL